MNPLAKISAGPVTDEGSSFSAFLKPAAKKTTAKVIPLPAVQPAPVVAPAVQAAPPRAVDPVKPSNPLLQVAKAAAPAVAPLPSYLAGAPAEVAGPAPFADVVKKLIAEPERAGLSVKTFAANFGGNAVENTRAVLADELLKKPSSSATNAQVFGSISPLAHLEAPTVQKLNEKFDIGMGGAGWDLGPSYLLPKKPEEYQGLDANGDKKVDAGKLSDGTIGFLQQMTAHVPDAYKNGDLNPEGWAIVSKAALHKKTLGMMLHTASIIAPAFGGPATALGTAGKGATAAIGALTSSGAMAQTLAAAAPAIVATAAGNIGGEKPGPVTPAVIENLTAPATPAASNSTATQTPAAVAAPVPDSTGLLLLVVAGAVLLLLGVKKHE